MTPPDSAQATAEQPSTGDSAVSPEAPAAQWADAHRPATALTWVDPAAVADGSVGGSLDDETEVTTDDALLNGMRRGPVLSRRGVLMPLSGLAGIVALYAGGTLLWPLHEVAPTMRTVPFSSTSAPAADILWPDQGSAAVGAPGLGTVASTLDRGAIASITKVVSSLMVLDRMPLAEGEQGPEFAFTGADNLAYWSYRAADQSALDVPVGGVLTELQLLQGTLLGSANNYIDRLSREIWGSDAPFAAAAGTWLSERGLDGITVATPSGFDARNTATPEALIALAEYAMQNPVFASIVGTASVDLPGAGTVQNTNGLLVDAGVVGVKTGTLGRSWNLLTAKDVTVGDATVRLYAAVLGQADDEQRLAETRALLAQVELSLRTAPPVVPGGTVVGSVETLWGARVDVVTAADADVVLWNAAPAEATTAFNLGDRRDEGDEVGTLTATGPVNSTTVALRLSEDVDGPSPWWRLTHPLELFGLSQTPR